MVGRRTRGQILFPKMSGGDHLGGMINHEPIQPKKESYLEFLSQITNSTLINMNLQYMN